MTYGVPVLDEIYWLKCRALRFKEVPTMLIVHPIGAGFESQIRPPFHSVLSQGGTISPTVAIKNGDHETTL